MRLAIRNQRGQAMVETGIVVTILVMLTVCIVEFGRLFMVANMIGHAARDAARAAAISIDRDTTTGILNASARTNIETQARDEISVVMPASNITGSCGSGTCNNGICFDQQPAGAVGTAIPTVKVTVCGAIPLITRLMGSSLTVNRTATFRDEGRGS